MLAASENNKEISLIEHAQLDHAFHLAICQASHNQVLVFTLQSLTDLMFNSVFASVNNLYHRPQQKQIDRQHARITTTRCCSGCRTLPSAQHAIMCGP